MFIKGFDENLQCRGFQFEVGKVYETGAKDDELSLCTNTVFHFCKSLEKVNNYYSVLPSENNRFCEIEVLGGFVEDDEKCGSNRIRVVREIECEELESLRGIKNGNTGIFNTGNRNTGDYNTGSYNTGDYNTGNCNTGYRNTGYRNTGNRNTGSYNTGSYNTGSWNKCDRSTGLFNTIEGTVQIFNKDSGLKWNEIINTDWYKALSNGRFILNKWIYYTDEEKENSPIRQAIGGYLKEYTYKEACENWWESLSDKNKNLIQKMPNFDKDIFKEITGIDVGKEDEE